MPKQITIGEPRYKKLELVEERYNLLINTWRLYMEAHGRNRPVPEEMAKQRAPKLTGQELIDFIRSDHCKGMFPVEVLVELERVGK